VLGPFLIIKCQDFFERKKSESFFLGENMNSGIWFWTVLLSLIPISELRGAIPFAIANGIPPYIAWPLCVGLNALVAPIVYIFLGTFHRLFYRWKWYSRLFDRFIEKARHKLHEKVERFGYWGVTLFVAIPFPITGAYTGTFGAWVLGLDKRKTILSVLTGVIISGTIVTAIVLFGQGAFSFFVKDIH
jgi:uncharacterized membrane protein